MKDNSIFHFKQFSVSHSRSSMKIGVDSVLIGAWANVDGKMILDVGTGCGIIALMLAQRNPQARIEAIDIDEASVKEADENFFNSKWRSRLKATVISFTEFIKSRNDKFDLIISNPPYYDSGITEFNSSRVIARHQNTLSPSVILKEVAPILKDDGRVAMIFPSELFEKIKVEAERNGFNVTRIARVRRTPVLPYKRVLIEFMREDAFLEGEGMTTNNKNVDNQVLKWEEITMFETEDSPTEEYQKMTHDFYLKF